MYEISLPLMLLTQSEFEQFSEDPIEYVRMQVDQSNQFNTKNIVKLLVESICGIRKNSREKVSDYLQNYLQFLVGNLQ